LQEEAGERRTKAAAWAPSIATLAVVRISSPFLLLRFLEQRSTYEYEEKFEMLVDGNISYS
jgi:hypothetical protein